VDESQFLKLQGYGDFHNGMYGNLILKINIIPVDNFEKMGNDLIYNVYYTLDDITSGKLEIPHPSGTISINLPEEFDTSKPLRIQSKGFNGGDLFIKQFVRFKRVVSE
jgi:DnaJ-class molecular chaperone